ncbi:MAG: PKD domain-containing protein [Methanomicrobiales archaeon]|nr:PKD domain-containing protein [Methanomicrobiales archaeon]
MYKSCNTIMPAVPACLSSYRLLPIMAILFLLIAGIPPAAGDTITCPAGYTCTSCGSSLCLVCPTGSRCLLDEDAASQLTNPEKIYNWACGYEPGIDKIAKFCYREEVNANPPVAKIIPDFFQHTAPVTVRFTAAESRSYTSQIASYSWNFGDGQTGSGVTVSHTYQNTGTYSPALTVTDTNGRTGTAYGTIILSSSVQKPQVIIDAGSSGTAGTVVTNQQNQRPVAVFSATPNYGTPPLAVSFDGQQSFAPDGSIAAYSWDFGDGTKGTGYVATHTYGKAGTYSASLTITDNTGSVSPASYATITVAESKPALIPGPGESGRPRITSLVSDPDYTNADFMQSDSRIEVIPREYKGSIAVSGGSLVIKGSHFGNQKGSVRMLLDEDIEGYSLEKPYAKMNFANTKNTPIWLGITQWSENEITLNIMDINTLLRTNFGGGKGKISVILPDGTTSNPYTFFLSPKWNLVRFSGAQFFNPSHNEDAMDGYTSQVTDHVIIVKHDPRCKDRGGTKDGDDGRDDFFRENRPLPPNVKFSKVRVAMIDQNQNILGFVLEKAWQLGSMITMNYYEIGKFVFNVFVAVFDDKAGSYEMHIHNEKMLDDPSLLTYERELMVNWENTCYSNSPNDDITLTYAAGFEAYVPDGVDLGD